MVSTPPTIALPATTAGNTSYSSNDNNKERPSKIIDTHLGDNNSKGSNQHPGHGRNRRSHREGQGVHPLGIDTERLCHVPILDGSSQV